MLSQVVNITGIQLSSLKPSEAEELLPKLLPRENSLVEVTVLDKGPNGTYKLLISGSVFQSKLPVNLNIGEALAAKVIGLNPFTLSLDHIFPAKMLNENNIALLLSKLGIAGTEISSKVLKAFLKEEKPLVKSKLEKVIELLEKEDIKLDDQQQLSLFIQMIHTDDFRGSFLKKSYAKMFRYSVEILAEEVLGSVKRLNSMGIPEEVISRINRALVLDFSETGSLDAIELKEKSSGKIEDQLNALLEKGTLLGDKVKNELLCLKEILIRFNMLRACYHRTGIYPGFIIIRTGDGLEMVEYRLENDSKEAGIKPQKLKLEMNPGSLGKITINGFLAGQTLSAAFGCSLESTSEMLNGGKEELIKALERINILPRLSFGSGVKTGEIPEGGSMRQVNVRI
ncbi:MAG: flagellar hook-length control protein FliK [Ignavibacteria bacterium]|jgi:hypothetical protein|nr:flagellar hook-length control protein FliK [Ignavibacteria bacterium]MCU7501920.1 flagellar hook-length control protein FliK [Ignavibacteria bacterium]MCU7514734.1 flagellar hook-length control protein FliK [Ignavibacteria bacterium]